LPDPIETIPNIIKVSPIVNVIKANGTAKTGLLYFTEKHPSIAVIVVQIPTKITGMAYLDSY
jgi:hypothetical protein